MLPDHIKPINFGDFNKEEWNSYLGRLVLPEDEALRQFYQQVVYDHFDHHNEHYPDFDIDAYTYSFVFLTAQEVKEKVRGFNNELIDWWSQQ